MCGAAPIVVSQRHSPFGREVFLEQKATGIALTTLLRSVPTLIPSNNSESTLPLSLTRYETKGFFNTPS